ncbi:MAG: HAMP domain-containing sensor histidine kinase [Pseudomonadota bacterium]
MYSLLPAVVSALFLAYGFYVVAERGFNRVSGSFFALCITTFFWQATWAILFQVDDPAVARVLIKFGYLLILFLPTSLYQFLVEISGKHEDRRWVMVSYGVAALLGIFDLAGNAFVDGYYTYFWGFYPKAGPLHPLHVLQTVVVVSRGLFITWQQQQAAAHDQQVRLRLCVASLLIYFLAAVDYLCNYGVEFYPPGVIFIAISLGLIAIAVTRYNLMEPVVAAATVAHEMRTPLASIRMQADALSQLLPELHRGYELAVSHGLVGDAAPAAEAGQLLALSQGIRRQVDRSNVVIDMMLASSRMEQIDTSTFGLHSMRDVVNEAVAHYPFAGREQQLVSVSCTEDFQFHGSDSLMVYVLYNLIKNSLYAIKSSGKGAIRIEIGGPGAGRTVTFTDTGSGIPAATLPRIFETFFTTKKSSGAGIGLAFCQRAVRSFGGRMHCSSVEGEYTTFSLEFPPQPATAFSYAISRSAARTP